MRRINKGLPSEDFERFTKKPHRQWDEAGRHIAIWRKHIIDNEQSGVSGYTEAPVDYDRSHIDHFLKRALFQDYIFRWENFVVDSCDEDFGAKYKDKHIHTEFDNLKLINPVDEDAERFFYYEANGKMIPANGLDACDYERAKFTIERFNLNHQSLKDRRKRILNLDISSYQGLNYDDILTALSCDGFESVARQALVEWMEQSK